MSTEEKMNIAERRKYLRMMERRYEQARRQANGRLSYRAVAAERLVPLEGT